MPTKRQNTPTEQNKEDNGLILYRLAAVEAAVRELSVKVDKQDNIKRSDIIELRNTILERITEIQQNLQGQIDKKADRDQVDDLRSLVKAVGGFLSVVIAGLVVFYITNKK